MPAGTPNIRRRRRRSVEKVIDNHIPGPADRASVIDHICRSPSRPLRDTFVDSDVPASSVVVEPDAEGDGPDVELGGGNGGAGEMGLWIPDLTLRYPPTFSHHDFIV